MPNIVTRFAPSPTGYLHVGGARTALFNWLLARNTGGKFLLRIEDTDLARSTQAAVDQLLDDLRWLGLNWDNAELVYQSHRLPIYNAIIQSLLDRGLAYKAWETTEELDAQRHIAERSRRQYRYRRPNLTDEQIRAYESENRPHVIRFAMPMHDWRFDDAVLGHNQGIAAPEVQDFIIRKSDGMPTYHFAVVVDDAEMNITHVLRGQEHLLNTVNHIALQEALGYPRPIYAHLPVILNVDGSKMGKRDRDKKVRHHTHMWLKRPGNAIATLADATKLPVEHLSKWLGDDARQLDPNEHAAIMPIIGLRAEDLPEILVHDFRKSGYLPEVLLNFLSLLGWSPGGDRERMTIDEMIRLFSLEHIGHSNAKFNREKLLAFNTEAFAAATPKRACDAMVDFLAVNPRSPLTQLAPAGVAPDSERIGHLMAMNAGLHILRDVDDKSGFLFVADDAIAYPQSAMKKLLGNPDGRSALTDAQSILTSIDPWTAHTIEAAIKAHCDATGRKLGAIAQPIRLAISGSTVSPPIFQTLEFLGKSRTLRRITRCLEIQVKE